MKSHLIDLENYFLCAVHFQFLRHGGNRSENRDLYGLFLRLWLRFFRFFPVFVVSCSCKLAVATSAIANRQRHQLGARLACISSLLGLHLTIRSRGCCLCHCPLPIAHRSPRSPVFVLWAARLMPPQRQREK